MHHRSRFARRLALVLAAYLACDRVASAQTVPSVSPVASPQATLSPARRFVDPSFRPAGAATRAWIAELRRTAYVAASGHRMLLGSAFRAIDGLSTSFPIAAYEPGVVRDARRGLVRVCFVSVPCRSNSPYTAVVRGADIPAPPTAVAGAVDDPSIGSSVPELLARFRRDPNFVGKNVLADGSGAVYFITSRDQDPPPARYDHGYLVEFENDYIVRDGRVVAHVVAVSEN